MAGRLTKRTRAPLTARRFFAATVQTTTFLGLAAFVVAYVALAMYLHDQRARTLKDAYVQTENLTRAFEQHIVRSIKSIDQALLFIRSQYEKDAVGFEIESWASRDYYLSDLAVQMAIIGPDGLLRNSNLASVGTVDLSDREHFKVHVDEAADTLFISKPVLGRVSNRWTIQLTRKIRKEDGSFGGVLVASIDPYHLSRLYESIDVGSGGAITLVGTDGIIRARGGMNSDVLGKSISSSTLFRDLAHSSSGTFQAPSSVDGVDRIISYRRVAAFPLVVTVSVATVEALADYEAAKNSLWQLLFLVAVFLGATIIWGVIQRFRLDGTRDSLLIQTRVLASTLVNMQEGILMIDAANDVVVMNDRARSLLNMPASFFELPFPAIHLPFNISKESRTEEHSFGGDVVLEIRTTLLPDGGYVKTFNDITDRKLVQRVLEDARDKAEAGSRARTAFLATMSHEIRTPLGGVLSMVDLIATTHLDESQRHYLDVTRGSAEHLLQLIDDILDVSKLDAEELKFEDIQFDLHRLVRDTIELVAPKAHSTGLSVGCLIAPDVPHGIVGDPGRLRQILLNLLGNAIKFTSEGHVLLDLSCKVDEQGRSHLVIRVEDTGIGIAQENLNDLFRDFSQIDSSISRRFGGTGLGLAICRKLSTRMGGQINVESTLGVGTTFVVELPLKVFGDPAPQVRDTSVIAVASTNAFESALLLRQLEPVFADVAVFATIADACAWLESRICDGRRILLVDQAIAPPEGISAYTAASGPHPTIEPFLIHAWEDFLTEADVRASGFSGFVKKPVFIEALRDSLSPPPRADASSESEAASSPKGGMHGALAGMQVLFAEDNPTNQFALGRIIELMGAHVTFVGNGREAVERASAEHFDFILMDVMMPQLDGLSATREIRALPEPFASVPIVALTANAFVEDREAALAAGVNSFATKPITGKRLLEAISVCVDVHDISATSHKPAPSAPPVAHGPVSDAAVLENLREELGADYVEAAIDIFLADLNARLAEMKRPNVARQDLGAHGHALKSSAGMLGLTSLADAAEQIEHSVKTGVSSSLDRQISSFVNEAAHAASLLRRSA
ncbi:MAG: Signal transduction histidine kinase [Hyphomicrobiales bacterium]|nr:Signal transduction histidine kinase [Hyphomicrobiales bacterium]